MSGDDLSMLMTVRLTLRRSRSIISWTWPLVGPCTDRTTSGTNTSRHTDPVHPQHYHNFLPVLWGLFCFEILCPEVSLSVLLSGVGRTFFCGAHSFESRFLKIQQLLETLFQLLWINNKDVFSRTNLQTTAETICLLNFGWFDRNQQLLW